MQSHEAYLKRAIELSVKSRESAGSVQPITGVFIKTYGRDHGSDLRR